MLLIDLTIVAIVLLLSMSLKLTDITQWNVGALVLEQFLLLTKWYLSRVLLISVKFNYMYFMTSLPGKNEVEVKFENSMHNYNATQFIDIIHWDVSAGIVVLVLMMFTK